MTYKALLLSLLLISCSTAFVQAQASEQHVHLSASNLSGFTIEAPAYVIGEKEAEITLTASDQKNQADSSVHGSFQVTVMDKQVPVEFNSGVAKVKVAITSSEPFNIKVGETTKELSIRHIPAWLSILPPLIAIVMALIFKEVVISLLTGIFAGALIIAGFHPINWIPALFAVVDKYILNALLDVGHLSVILFSVTIGGMVAVISRNGGMAGIVEKLSKYARSPRSTQLITWFLGVAIFFDDYANTLIVGNTMRPVTDKYRISREKLAYIVDSTAAPVAAVAFVTTWIGAEIGYIKDASKALGIEEGAYSMFLNSLQYAFYPVFTLVFMLLLIFLKKDYGKMLEAEIRARTTGVLNAEVGGDTEAGSEALKAFEPVPGARLRWYNALLPVLAVIIITLAGLIYTGLQTSAIQISGLGVRLADTSLGAVWQQLGLLSDTGEASATRKLGILIGNSDAYVALLWSSLSGLFIAIFLTVFQRILSLHKTIDSMIDGFKAMVPAMLILIFAWSLSKVTEDLHTADFITSLFSGNVAPWLMPSLTFLLAAVISFSTGSSWGTMAILYPLILPATWALSATAGMDEPAAMEIMYNVISVVLAGAVFGDHCSPISDTTILSSLSSSCNHIAHVKTQFPYAVTVAAVSIFVNIVLVNLGSPWFVNFPVGILLLFLIVKYAGKRIEASVEESALR